MPCGMAMYWTCFSIDLYGEQSGVKVEIGDDQLTEVCDDGILIRYCLCLSFIEKNCNERVSRMDAV